MNKELEIHQYNPKDLKPSPWNRTADGNGEMKELIESVKMHGILQPIIVRDTAGESAVVSDMEIVAGHRRWLAAKMAGLKEVPCIVKNLSDQDAKVAQITENLHRKNLNAMEEARAFMELRNGNAHTAQTIADMAGKDVKYVHRALELLKLPKGAQTALEEGLLSAAHGHQLVRVGVEQLPTILKYALTKDYHNNVPTVEDLKNFIRKGIAKSLSSAPWDKKAPYAGQMACAGCSYNSANQDMLFEGAEAGQCTNGKCFGIKLKQSYKDLQVKGEKRWPTMRFVGMATSRYGSEQTIKNYHVVDAASPEMKAALKLKEDDPKMDAYGFGILKPSNWGDTKVATLVLVKKLPEGKKASDVGYHTPTREERCHEQTVQKLMKRHVALNMFADVEITPDVYRAIIKDVAVNQYSLANHRHWFAAAGIDVEGENAKGLTKSLAKAINELPASKAMALAFWIMVDENQEELAANLSEVDISKLTREGLKMGEAFWKENKDSLVAEFIPKEKRS